MPSQNSLGVPWRSLCPRLFDRSTSGYAKISSGHRARGRWGKGRRLSARRKDGHEIPVSVGLNPVTIGANPVVVIVSLTDTSAQERADRAELLVRELTHRAKNMFAVISAMSHQIGAVSADIASFQADFDERLKSFSASHELLARENWRSIPIADLVRSQLAFVSGHDATQVTIEGPALRLPASPAEYLGLALHELASNAMKHGALSVPGGKIHVVWKTDKAKQRFLFDWRELDGPPVAEPLRKGFGTRHPKDRCSSRVWWNG